MNVADFNFESLKKFAILFYEKKKRQLSFTRPKQVKFLRIFSELMKVGRLPYDIADYIAKYGDPVERQIAIEIKANLGNGLSICDALDGWIDPMSLAALRAAEEGGQEGFVLALTYVAEEMETQSTTSAGALKKMIYPGVYAVTSFGIVIALHYNMIPMMRDMNRGMLPKDIQATDDYAVFLINWGWLYTILFVALLVGFKYLQKNLVGETRDKLEMIKIVNWYPFGGYRLLIGSHIVASFALLKRFDFPAFMIYRILEQEGSIYQKHHVSIMREQLKDGNENEIESMDSGLLEPQYISLLKLYAGAESTSYVSALNSASKDIGRRCIDRMKINGEIIFYALWGVVIYNLSMVVNVLMSTGNTN